MNIVINTKTVSKNSSYDQQFFFVDCFVKIINSYPEHSFFLIADIDTSKFFISKNKFDNYIFNQTIRSNYTIFNNLYYFIGNL